MMKININLHFDMEKKNDYNKLSLLDNCYADDIFLFCHVAFRFVAPPTSVGKAYSNEIEKTVKAVRFFIAHSTLNDKAFFFYELSR